jgi:hypothetical protein
MVINALVADGQSELAAGVARGAITQAQADAQKAEITPAGQLTKSTASCREATAEAGLVIASVDGSRLERSIAGVVRGRGGPTQGVGASFSGLPSYVAENTEAPTRRPGADRGRLARISASWPRA